MASSTVAVPAASVSGGTGLNLKEEVDGRDMFEHDLTTINGNGCNNSPNTGEALEEIHCGMNESRDQECTLCTNKLCSPRVLSCLHVFCETCLDKLLIDEAGDSKVGGIISCPICHQETTVGSTGAASLTCDYVLTNILDMSAIESMAVLCTSCKAKESAVARCSDCANFLCPNCNTAHQFMRCFESHKVVAFDDLKQSTEAVPIHKPIFCQFHPAENMKFYCYSCEEPICNECLLVEHKAPEHRYERISDAEPRQRKELKELMNESKAKIADCDHVSTQLENALSELQAQHDQAKDLIIETFQSYKAVLEKCRDNALHELERLHSNRELEIMDTFHSVEKTVEKIEDACRFTSRLLEHGDAVELLALWRIVGNQLVNLIKNTPKPDVNFSIEFQTDYDQFEQTVKEVFGKFHTERSAPIKAEPEPVTVVPSVSPSQPIVHTSIGCPSSISTSSPISLPASIQSSFEGEPPFVIPPTSSPQNIPPPPPPVSLPPGSIHRLTSIQEYNLQQLASLAEKVDMVGDTSVVGPSSNPSPTQSFTLADLFAGDLNSTSHAINNLQALAKLGNTLRNQDEAIISDLGNTTINGSAGLVLGRGPSPAIAEPPTLGPLATNSLLNGGFQSLSASTSPILSQNADELMQESINNIPVVVGNSVPNMTGIRTGSFSHFRSNNAKLTPMQIRSKFGQLGPSRGQFNAPHGFCLGTDEDIIVADTNNHRIQVFEKTGAFKFQFGVPGKEEGQLWYPRKVAVMRLSGKFVVCDRGNERSRMQIFTKNGQFIKKIAIRYIDIVAGLAVTSQGYIVAVDSVSPTVFVINDAGELVRWFDCSDYMREPSDIAISGKEYFVCDFKGHCVVVFSEEGKFLRRIGCEKVTNFPNGIDISDAGDVLIGDSHGNRFHVAVFSRDGSLISEFECPYVKVSRCCGLKITSEGYIVTLAKNNHHVLILNTLYIL